MTAQELYEWLAEIPEPERKFTNVRIPSDLPDGVVVVKYRKPLPHHEESYIEFYTK